MHSTSCVLALIGLLVGLVHSFSWDFVTCTNEGLEFHYNGRITHTEIIHSANLIHSVTYDPVNYRVFFADYNRLTMSISSFDLLTKKTQLIFTFSSKNTVYRRIVYDPLTEKLYSREKFRINSISLKPASSNKTVDGNLVLSVYHICEDFAVDSCGGYIYWITQKDIGRIRLDGSEREVLINDAVWGRNSLAIDQQTQKMYWTEKRISNQVSIESANFNGKNRTTFYIVRNVFAVHSLVASKDFIYWQNYKQEGIWQLPKNQTQLKATKLYTMSRSICPICDLIAANYTIKEQIQGIKSCDALQRLIPLVCQNYCFQGECSISADGQPTCSCKAGYSGERCEINAHQDYCLHGGDFFLNEKNKRVCQCTAGYEGERCEVSVCKDYCFHGNCSVGAEGLPKCSCKAGYSGERCEVNTCYKHCFNGGVCTQNKEDVAVCQCTAGYEGERCEVSVCKDYCFHGNCSVGAEGQPKCSCMIGYSGVRCEVNVCHEYCLNGGVCSLNEEDEPCCQCTADYDGGRCELSANNDNSCDAGNSGEGTVSACRQFCLNNGVCTLNEAGEPVCQCTADYEGKRCHVPAFVVKWFLYAYKRCSERCSQVDACFECCLNNGACSERARDTKRLKSARTSLQNDSFNVQGYKFNVIKVF